MEEIRDIYGKLVCMVDHRTGRIERSTTKEKVIVILPPGGKIAIDAKSAYTEIVREGTMGFLVKTFPNQ